MANQHTPANGSGPEANQRSAITTIGRSIRTVVQAASRALSWIAGGVVMVLMFIVVAEVVLRDMFQTTLGGTIEISEILLVFLVFVGLPYAQQVGGHVSTDLLTARIPVRAARVLRVGGLLVTVGVLLWATKASAVRGWDSMQTGESRFGIREVPIWPARLVVPLGLFLTALETLISAVETMDRRWRPGPPSMHDGAALPAEVMTP